MTGKKDVGMNYQHYITREKLVETVNTSGLPMCDIVGILRELLRRGIICNLSHGRTLRLLPALTIDAADLDTFLETLEAILSGR